MGMGGNGFRGSMVCFLRARRTRRWEEDRGEGLAGSRRWARVLERYPNGSRRINHKGSRLSSMKGDAHGGSFARCWSATPRPSLLFS